MRWTIDVFQIVGDEPSLPPLPSRRSSSSVRGQFCRVPSQPKGIKFPTFHLSWKIVWNRPRIPAASPQDRHGKFRDGFFKPSKRLSRTFPFRATDHVKPLGRFESLRQTVATAIGCQQEGPQQRVQIPPWAFPPFRNISHLLENLACEKISHRTHQRFGPPSLTGVLPCACHKPFLHDRAWDCGSLSSPERLFFARPISWSLSRDKSS